MPTGDVQLSILDGGGAVVVPQQNIQVVMGTSSSGTTARVVATRNPNTVTSNFGYGPMPEACAATIAAGGIVLALKTATNTNGSAGAVTAFATGTSVVTVTGNPFDTYFVKMLVVVGGTVGSTGIQVRFSLDAGRTYGPVIALGTSVSYALTNTGMTLNFAAGTMVANEFITFGTTEPLWNAAGIQACMNALQQSQYATSGWGSTFLTGAINGANATTVGGYMGTWQTGKIFSRIIMSARDAQPAAIWSGTPETESTWMNAVLLDYSSTANTRISVTAGHYNIVSQLPNPVAGLPRYRRPLSFAYAPRQVKLAPQRHAGRVKDGSLTSNEFLIVDPVNDPADGFIYHDERLNPGFDAAKFTSAWTRVKKKGFWIVNPNLMSPVGSVFTILPLGNVMDIACGIVNDVATLNINDDVRLNNDGTIFVNDALAIQQAIKQALRDNMQSKNMISGMTVVVDQTNNVFTTSVVNIAVTIVARGYILEEDITIGYGTSAPQP